ncbi:MAG: AAA-like domain-containing protein [Clostridium sp.]|nr:AAA-like domain-containing protein [Clostridium sp.]
MKEFNTTGLCNPKKHYMVDISNKLDDIKKLVEKEKYFIINRPRQYGKTTTLFTLKRELSKKYLVISISFEGIGDTAFTDEEKFVRVFIDLIEEKLEYLDESLSEKFTNLSKDVFDFPRLSRMISKFIKESHKETILIIDEVDKSANNQLFLSFLGMLRNKYLQREEGEGYTFKSVILAGVYDIRNLKLKLRPDEERKYNSPWNIAVPFNIDMSLSGEGIEGMLKEYKNDKNLKFDTLKAAEFIYFYTSGYPFLVSRICQIIDEDLGASWNEENMIRAIKLLLDENNTLFDDLVKNIENNNKLQNLIESIVIDGKIISFNLSNPIINLGVILGILSKKDNKVSISNRIYEQYIYDYLSSKIELSNNILEKYNFKSDFIEGNGLNVEKILLRFQQFMKENYSKKDEVFLEREGRLLFLAFIKPTINGVGYAFKEVQISEEKRLDVVIVYNTNKYIIELKIWHGEKYHERGLKQLSDYLEINGQDKGYLLIFNFNKDKEYKKEVINNDGKEIIAVFV